MIEIGDKLFEEEEQLLSNLGNSNATDEQIKVALENFDIDGKEPLP